jgi:AAA15 family ATPase/GTPase
MNLIKTIEIRYFRSIYLVRLKNISDLIIFSGVNDVGKSNILKALNLFFNNETDWGRFIEFEENFSRQRLSEVRKESIKGKQFISVSIEFNCPSTYQNSLPNNFRVTRYWLRGDFIKETNNLESLHKKGKLPSSLNTANRFVSKFLNKIHFEYVPAIKDRKYYMDLLSRLQDTILDVKTQLYPEILQLTERLAPLIQNKIITLQEEFKRSTGIESAITPPNDFASLFQAFDVSTSLGDEHDVIPLMYRGDGIQAKYLLSVLRYILENTNYFFILGIEEPENSLEYSQVVKMAEDFAKIYPNKAQIFLTTHSPALISIREKNTTIYRVYRGDNNISKVVEIWPKVSEKERQELNIEIGFMQLQEEMNKEYVANFEKLEWLRKHVETLEKEIKESQKPLILTEGKYDTKILEIAWQKLYEGRECPFILRPVAITTDAKDGSSGGAYLLRMAIETVHPSDMRKAIAIFDRDAEGIKEFNKLSRNFKMLNQHDSLKMHSNNLAFAMLLPTPLGRENYASNESLSIEFMFPDEVLHKQTSDGRSLKLKRPLVEVKCKNRTIRKLNQGQLTLIGFRDIWYEIADGKKIFATEIVPTLDANYFNSFNSLFDLLEKIIMD